MGDGKWEHSLTDEICVSRPLSPTMRRSLEMIRLDVIDNLAVFKKVQDAIGTLKRTLTLYP